MVYSEAVPHTKWDTAAVTPKQCLSPQSLPAADTASSPGPTREPCAGKVYHDVSLQLPVQPAFRVPQSWSPLGAACLMVRSISIIISILLIRLLLWAGP